MPAQPLGPTGLLAQSMTLPAGSQSMAMGGMGLRAQGMDGRKNGAARTFQLSPAVSGKAIWNLDTDGPLNLGTQGNWYATPLSTFSVSAKLWGEGGDGNRSGLFGAGAFSEGVITFIAGTTYRLGVGQGRGAQSAFNGAGGGWSGVLIDAPSTAILIAAGGGANGWNTSGGIKGGAGGWPNGISGEDDPNTNYSIGGGGGGQSSGGSGGGATGTFAQAGTSGTSLQGGGGGYAGGGGGGGYFGGGGGGGADVNGAGGGGGSSYFNPALVIAQSMLSGSGTTPGNSSDADRAGAGVSFSGRLILK